MGGDQENQVVHRGGAENDRVIGKLEMHHNKDRLLVHGQSVVGKNLERCESEPAELFAAGPAGRILKSYGVR